MMEELQAIANAADALEEWLANNAGHSADWPLRMVLDNEAEGDHLRNLLQALNLSLKPYRLKSQTNNQAIMELETVNKLFLELSQFATAKTKRELELEELLRSAHCIAIRNGEGTHWARFAASIQKLGVGSVTARTYRVLEGDKETA